MLLKKLRQSQIQKESTVQKVTRPLTFFFVVLSVLFLYEPVGTSNSYQTSPIVSVIFFYNDLPPNEHRVVITVRLKVL